MALAIVITVRGLSAIAVVMVYGCVCCWSRAANLRESSLMIWFIPAKSILSLCEVSQATA